MLFTLDKRCQEIIKTIMYTNGYIKVQDLADEMHVSRRSVYYDINKINEWLEANQIEPLVQERGKGIHISSQQVTSIQELLFASQNTNNRVFTPEERYHIEICSIITSTHEIFIEDFMNTCDVSRNTIISDLKSVTNILKGYNLELIYSLKAGYTIAGDPIRKRALFFLLFPPLWEYYDAQIISSEQKKDITYILSKLKQIENDLQAEFVSGVLPSLAFFISTLPFHQETIEFSDMDVEEIEETTEYELVEQYFNELSEPDKIYVSLHLLGSRLQTVPVNVMKVDSKSRDIAIKLVKAFETISLMDYEHKDELINAVNAHFQTSMYRYRYGIQLGNPLLDSIKSEYSELFELTKQAVKDIKEDLGYVISDAEIAYLTLHFGAFMTPKNEKEHTYRILIICPNGIGTGNMIKNEVTSLVPQATDIQNIPLSTYDPNHDFDVVISTVPLPKEKKLVLVHPILTDQDRVTILRKCMYNEPQVRMQIDDIMKIVSKYVNETVANNIKQDLQDYYASMRVGIAPQKDYGYGLIHYLKSSHIKIFNENYSWEQALRESSNPLLMEDSITQEYIDTIINDQKENQMYMFLADQLVLAHTAAENGVKRVDVSLGIFKQPVTFLNGKKARIIFTLCAEDQTKHLKILNDILDLFSKKKSIDQLVKFDTSNQVLEYIQSRLEENNKS